MNAQRFLDAVIRPTLVNMEEAGNYNTYSSRMLLLATAAIESEMGLYNQQLGGPAISAFQLEPLTITDIAMNWDAFPDMRKVISDISMLYQVTSPSLVNECEVNQRLACLMARGKYAMDPEPLPAHDDKDALYKYYKRVYNTGDGKSTYVKWCSAWKRFELDKVEL